MSLQSDFLLEDSEDHIGCSNYKWTAQGTGVNAFSHTEDALEPWCAYVYIIYMSKRTWQ